MTKKTLIGLIIFFSILSCSNSMEKKQNNEVNPKPQDWKTEVTKTLKLFGHRNWIVIADAAYPQQSNPAIHTITIEANHLETIEFVNGLIEKASHVNANIFVDKEMDFVPEMNAKGIVEYRNNLKKVLEGKPVRTMLHEDIIRELDSSAQLFNVLIIKTDFAIPYTSVFFQLECGYWNDEAEKNLRIKLMEK